MNELRERQNSLLLEAAETINALSKENRETREKLGAMQKKVMSVAIAIIDLGNPHGNTVERYAHDVTLRMEAVLRKSLKEEAA